MTDTRTLACGDAQGTYAGAQRHYRAGEDPCDPCYDAKVEYRRGHYQRTRSPEWRRRVNERGERITVASVILDLAETYYPDTLTTEVLIARTNDLHPEWSVESIRRNLQALSSAERLELVEMVAENGGGEQARWRFIP